MSGYRDIVVDACPRRDLLPLLGFAREMAEMFGAKLSATSYIWPRITIRDAFLRNAFRDQEQTTLMECALTASRSAFDKVFADRKEKVDWHAGIGDPALEMQAHLFAADLLITDATAEETWILPNPAYIALDSGVPVLRLGQLPARPSFANVFVAWKDSSQARRAVHDALPILARADRVTVIGVGDEVPAERIEAVSGHLARHKVKARHWHIPNTTGDVCESLLAQARREGVHLIVTGAYSRGSLAERVLGGVTTSMLKNPEIPWFMAH